MPDHLFVYGSLMNGFELHDSAGLSARSECNRAFYDLGEYPALVDGDGKVEGELCVVSDAFLAEPDGYKGYRPTDTQGSLYVRERREVEVTDDEAQGDEVGSWVYVYNRAMDKDAERVESGDWRDIVGEERG